MSAGSPGVFSAPSDCRDDSGDPDSEQRHSDHGLTDQAEHDAEEAEHEASTKSFLPATPSYLTGLDRSDCGDLG